MSCPAVCAWDPAARPEFSLAACQIDFLTSGAKHDGTWWGPERINGHRLPSSWASQEARFDFISEFVMGLVQPDDRVTIEGYSYGSKGVVFHIGEFTGLLKHKLHRRYIPFDVVAPSAVKKLATGKGNANKAAMAEAFARETGVDLRARMGLTPSQESPAADAVDAFYVCKSGLKKVR